MVKQQFDGKPQSSFSAWVRDRATSGALRLEPILKAKAVSQQGKRTDLLLKSGKGSKVKPIHVDKELAKIAGVSADTIAKTRDIQKHADEATKTALRTSKDKSLNRVASGGLRRARADELILVYRYPNLEGELK